MKNHNLMYKGCGTCAHASGTPLSVNFHCKMWDCSFNKTRSCEYYLRFDDPSPYGTTIKKPTERELDLIHFRRYTHLDDMQADEVERFNKMSKRLKQTIY